MFRKILAAALLFAPVAAYAFSPPVSADYTLTSTPQTVLNSNLPRVSWRMVNLGAANAYCTDDGTTPTATHATFVVFAGGQSDSSGAPTSPAALQCIGSGIITVESWQLS